MRYYFGKYQDKEYANYLHKFVTLSGHIFYVATDSQDISFALEQVADEIYKQNDNPPFYLHERLDELSDTELDAEWIALDGGYLENCWQDLYKCWHMSEKQFAAYKKAKFF